MSLLGIQGGLLPSVNLYTSTALSGVHGAVGIAASLEAPTPFSVLQVPERLQSNVVSGPVALEGLFTSV